MFEWVDGLSLTWIYLILVIVYGLTYGAIKLLMWVGREE